MNRFAFVFRTTFQIMIKNKGMNVITLLSFTLGLFFAAFILVFGYSLLQDLNTNAKLETVIVEMRGYVSQGKSFDPVPMVAIKQFESKYKEIEYIDTVITSTELVVHQDKFDLMRNIAYVSDHIYQMYVDFIVKGNWFSNQSIVNECIIGSQVSFEYYGKGNPINQIVNVDGVEYTVVGVTDHSQYRDSFILPIVHYQNPFVQDITTYYIKLSNKHADYSSFKNDITKNFGSYEFISLQDKNDKERSNIIISILTILIVSSIVLLFSILNTIGIFTNRIQEQQARIATQIALGAKSSDIYLQVLIELGLVALFAAILVYSAIWFISGLQGILPFPLHVDVTILLVLIAIAIAVVMIVTAILIKRMPKLQICEVLRG